MEFSCVVLFAVVSLIYVTLVMRGVVDVEAGDGFVVVETAGDRTVVEMAGDFTDVLETAADFVERSVVETFDADIFADFVLVFGVFFGVLLGFFRFGVEPSSEPVKSIVLRRRFNADFSAFRANFLARIFRFLIFFERLEWQSLTLKSKSLSRSLSLSLTLKSE